MATKSSSVSTAAVVERTIPMNVGIAVGSAIDSESDIVLGFKAARAPSLVEARKAVNIARRSALTAQLLADLSI